MNGDILELGLVSLYGGYKRKEGHGSDDNK